MANQAVEALVPLVPVDGNPGDGECGHERDADGPHGRELAYPLQLGSHPPVKS